MQPELNAEPERADQLALAEAFDAARPRLVNVAYAVLGSRHDAEDVVQGVWIRLASAHENDPVRDVMGWATVATARASLDELRSARVRRETYVGPWLPEPVVADWAEADPAEQVSLDESVRFALLVMLERLSPAERTAWVLHDLFGVPFPEVAVALGRSPEAVRQLASRSRARLRAEGRYEVDREQHDGVVGAFVMAAAGGDLVELVKTLAPDVVLTSDGGGVVSAARRVVEGPDRVARFLLGVARKQEGNLNLALVNGASGLVVKSPDGVHGVLAFAVADGLITRVDIVLAPDKLRRVSLG